MSELRDRLEALANRGTRRGADDVLSAAQRDAAASPDESTADLDGTDMQIIDDDLPVVALENDRRRRRRFGSIVASAGIAALVGVGVLAVTAMFGSGGAGSPEGAVRQLASAVNNKDALAAVDVLVPSEVHSMRESVKHATERAAELHIVNEASKPLAGVDLSVANLDLTTEPLADGYAKVIITRGDFSASTHRAELSALLQKAQRDGEDAQNHADLSKLAAGADLPTFVVVVRQGGGWYVSPAYTTLEYLREANQFPAADFGSAKAAELGATTPEGAVNDALFAWQSADWNRLIALAPPDELPVFDYRAMIAASAADLRPDFTIANISTTSTINGDTAVVKLEASGTWGSDPVQHWQVGGTCPDNRVGWMGYTRAYDDSSTPSSASNPELCLAGDVGQAVPFGLFAARATVSEASSGPVSIELVREDGRWFVSPVTTALDVLNSAIDHVDERTVYSVLNIAWDLPPDGTITLGQPFEVSGPTSYLAPRVYTFDGQAGQELVGSDSTSSADSGYTSNGQIYTAEGDEVGTVGFGSYPSTVTLPHAGSYRLVLDAFGVPPTGTTLTLWDLATAPKSLRDEAASGRGETCSSSGPLVLGGSSVSCGASGVGDSVPVGPGIDPAAPRSSCAVTNGELKCGDLTIGRVCPTGTAPSAAEPCLPPDVVDSILAGQGPGAVPTTTTPSKSVTATTAPVAPTTGWTAVPPATTAR